MPRTPASQSTHRTRPATLSAAFPMALWASLALTGCGGGDDAPASPAPIAGTPSPAPAAPAPAPAAPAPTTTVTGSVVKGPVAGAQVCAYTVVANGRGSALGSCTTSDAQGRYSFAVPAGTGPLWVEATGGTYTDEATGAVATLPAGSTLRSIVTANAGTVTTMLTPLTTLALNSAIANLGTAGQLNAATFSAAAAQLLSSFNLPATLNLTDTTPTFGTGINSYGTALTVISQMVANGTTLASLLANTNPQALAAAYAAAATPPAPPTTPPATGSGGGTASGSVTSTGGVDTFVPRSNPGGTSPVFRGSFTQGIGMYNFYSYQRGADSAGNSGGVATQGFSFTLINGRLAGVTFIESTLVRGFNLSVARFCSDPCTGATVTPTANGLGVTLTLSNARFEFSRAGTTLTPAPTEPIVMNGTLTGAMPGN